MLMKHTPEAVAERTALSINPAKTCMPIGAMYAALGIMPACLTATVPRAVVPIIAAC